MPKEIISYQEAIQSGQQAWQDARAKGLLGLTQKHQTIELPLCGRRQFKTKCLMPFLLLQKQKRSSIGNIRPPLWGGVPGWTTGIGIVYGKYVSRAFRTRIAYFISRTHASRPSCYWSNCGSRNPLHWSISTAFMCPRNTPLPRGRRRSYRLVSCGF